MKVITNAGRGALVAVVVVALAGLIAGCGSASGSSSTTTTSSTTASAAGSGGSNTSRRAALVACLKQHGVTLPARPAGGPPPGSGGGTGTNGTGTNGTGTNGTGTTPRRGFFGGGGFAANPKLRAAFQACGAKLGFRSGGQGFRGRISRAAITKYVTCVRQHGYDLPNANLSGKGPVFPSTIRTNKKFQAASRVCQNLLVPPRPSGSGGRTSTTAGA